jgi:hypothetical protein
MVWIGSEWFGLVQNGWIGSEWFGLVKNGLN